MDEVGRLRGALLRLSEEQRRAIVLAGLSGCSGREVAEIEDIPLGTAKTRIRTALLRLRASSSTRSARSDAGHGPMTLERGVPPTSASSRPISPSGCSTARSAPTCCGTSTTARRARRCVAELSDVADPLGAARARSRAAARLRAARARRHAVARAVGPGGVDRVGRRGRRGGGDPERRRWSASIDADRGTPAASAPAAPETVPMVGARRPAGRARVELDRLHRPRSRSPSTTPSPTATTSSPSVPHGAAPSPITTMTIAGGHGEWNGHVGTSRPGPRSRSSTRTGSSCATRCSALRTRLTRRERAGCASGAVRRRRRAPGRARRPWGGRARRRSAR